MTDVALTAEVFDDAPPRAGLVLAVLCGAQLLLALTITVVLVGGSAVKDTISMADGDVHWLVTSYALALGGLVLLAGRLGDTLGHRRMFLVGLSLFGITSLLVAVAQNTIQITVARGLQGVAAAVVSPATLALLTEAFVGQRQRARAFAAWSLAGSSGGVVGYVVGGAIIDSIGWRWAFAVNAPIAAVGVVGARLLIAPSVERRRTGEFDVLGALAISGAAFAVVFGFGRVQTDGWLAVSTITAFMVGVLLTAGFVSIENRAPQPLIPLRLIRRPEFAANVMTLCASATVGGTLLVSSLFLQDERDFSARGVGLATLPVPIGVAVGVRLTTVMMRRRQNSHGLEIAATGQALAALAYGFLVFRIADESYVTTLLPAWFVMGIGISMTSIPAVSYATSGTAAEDRGVVSGMFNMSQQLGTALGVAALWSVAQVAASRATPTAAVDAARAGFAVAFAIAAVNALFAAAMEVRRLRRGNIIRV